jgi:hypothetical protein
MTQREADLGKRRRYADDRRFVAWVPSLTSPPAFMPAPDLVGGKHLWRMGSDSVWVLTVALMGRNIG